MEAWDRQPGETAKAYAAFGLYRDLGPSRSAAKVREKYGKNLRALVHTPAR